MNSSKDSITQLFGYACGITGSPQPFTVKTIRYVNNVDSVKIRNLATSDNPQEKIHGLLGLYLLGQNGFILSTIDKELIKAAKVDSIEVEVCEGCYFGLRRSFKYLLDKKNLKSFYNWYKLAGWKNLK